MVTKNLGEIKAVAFDIDGTLYKGADLYVRMSFHFLRHNQFFLKYGLVRKALRKHNVSNDFENVQARYMGERLKVTAEEAKKRLDKIVYSGLTHYFSRINPCKNVVETIISLHDAGFKIGLLSDFPPEQKGDIWGLKPYCDVLLGTEACGALKPSPIPFQKLAEELGVNPSEILYVGNSYKYDVCGSRNVGMKSAWFVSSWKKRFHSKKQTADIVFSKYLDLKDFILEK